MALYELRLKLDERLIASIPSTVSADIVRESAEGQRAALARLLDSRTRPDNPMRDLPVVVLTRGQGLTKAQAENHAGLARLSKNSRHIIVPDAGHEIHLFAPTMVVQAIQDVRVAARQQKQLASRN